jgi:hypothetical protein
MDDIRKISQGQLLTSSRESADPWASRETSVSFDLFNRLALRVTVTFLIEALGAFGDFTPAQPLVQEVHRQLYLQQKEKW